MRRRREEIWEQNRLHPQELRPGVRAQGGDLFHKKQTYACGSASPQGNHLSGNDARGGSGNPALCPESASEGCWANAKPSIAWGRGGHRVGGFLMPYRDPRAGTSAPAATALNGQLHQFPCECFGDTLLLGKAPARWEESPSTLPGPCALLCHTAQEMAWELQRLGRTGRLSIIACEQHLL